MQIIPTLRVISFEESKFFYLNGLGFEIQWQHQFEPNFPIFAALQRDGQTIYLTEHAGDCEPKGLVYLYVSDVHTWYKRLIDGGFQISPPRQQPWGQLEMRVKDLALTRFASAPETDRRIVESGAELI